MQNRNDDDAFDERGLLRDGRTYHVPLRFCDAMQRDVAKQIKREHPQHVTDQAGNAGLSLNRPGFRTLSGRNAGDRLVRDGAQRDAEEAYAIDEHYKTNAWRDALLDENDADDALFAAKQEARSTDAYAEYEAEMRDAWRRG